MLKWTKKDSITTFCYFLLFQRDRRAPSMALPILAWVKGLITVVSNSISKVPICYTVAMNYIIPYSVATC